MTSQAKLTNLGLPLIRQPEQTAVQQLKCDQIFTWPSDQPRHATGASHYPIETRSPPAGATDLGRTLSLYSPEPPADNLGHRREQGDVSHRSRPGAVGTAGTVGQSSPTCFGGLLGVLGGAVCLSVAIRRTVAPWRHNPLCCFDLIRCTRYATPWRTVTLGATAAPLCGRSDEAFFITELSSAGRVL